MLYPGNCLLLYIFLCISPFCRFLHTSKISFHWLFCRNNSDNGCILILEILFCFWCSSLCFPLFFIKIVGHLFHCIWSTDICNMIMILIYINNFVIIESNPGFAKERLATFYTFPITPFYSSSVDTVSIRISYHIRKALSTSHEV